MSQHVIIIGAGLGGLCLAQGLKKAGISFSVYERDLSLLHRAQGYRLRINNMGTDGLEANLSEEVFTLFKRTCAVLGRLEVNRMDMSTGLVSGRMNPPRSGDDSRIFTADRTVLRRVLISGIESHVHYDKSFKKYTQLDNGRLLVEFEDGTTEEGDLLVGADGRGSKVRRQFLPDDNPVDLGARALFGKTPITDDLIARFSKECSQSTMSVVSDMSRLLHIFLEPIRFKEDPSTLLPGLPSVPDYYYWVLLSTMTTFGPDEEFLHLPKDALKDKSIALTQPFHESYHPLFELQSPQNSSALLVATAPLDVPAWNSSNITFIGDAIHTMLPFAQGANVAMHDARLLCDAIKSGVAAGKIDVADYESKMREYASTAIKEAYQVGLKFGVSTDISQAKPLLH